MVRDSVYLFANRLGMDWLAVVRGLSRCQLEMSLVLLRLSNSEAEGGGEKTLKEMA